MINLKDIAKKPINLLLAAAFAIIIILLLADRCNSNKPPATITKYEKERVDTMYVKDFRVLDSFQRVIQVLKKSKDSALIIADGIKRKMNGSIKQAEELAVMQALAKYYKDTLKYVLVSDSLGGMIDELSKSNDEKDKAHAATLLYYQDIMNEQERVIKGNISTLSELKGSFDKVSNESLSIGAQLAKAQKKNSRKYNVSLSVSYGITPTGAPMPSIGISIGRTLFKF